MPTSDDPPRLRLGHSPDPDDAFMWWPLFDLDGSGPRLPSARFRYEPVTQDIETLNRRAESAELEITALSCAQYARVADTYVMTACGASMGDAYGPKLVTRQPAAIDDLRGSDPLVAIPGERTTAFAAATLMLGPFRHETVDFETVIDRVAAGDFDAGIVIHEGQLTFGDAGLHLVADLGAWWHGETGLPMPLGVNAVRRDLETRHGPGTLAAISRELLASVRYAMEHRAESIEYALNFARGMPAALADEFVELYVNRWTLDFGETGRAAVDRFLAEAAAAGLVPEASRGSFVAAGP